MYRAEQPEAEDRMKRRLPVERRRVTAANASLTLCEPSRPLWSEIPLPEFSWGTSPVGRVRTLKAPLSRSYGPTYARSSNFSSRKVSPVSKPSSSEQRPWKSRSPVPSVPVLTPREVSAILERVGFVIYDDAVPTDSIVTPTVAARRFHFIEAATSRQRC